MSAPSNGVDTTASSSKMPSTAPTSTAATAARGTPTTGAIRNNITNPSLSTTANATNKSHDKIAPLSLSLPIRSITNPQDGGTNDPNTAAAAAADPALAALRTASSSSDIRAALSALHARESSLTTRLSFVLASHQDLARSLSRLDNLRAGLGSQVIAARSVSNNMLAGAADTASHLSSRVRQLDLEKQRVEDTLRVVELVAELKACVAGVVGSMGAPQDWEAAAGYIARAARVPEEIVRSGFAAAVVPTVEVPDAPWVTLENARESLCVLFLREFWKAAKEDDPAKITRFFKLFPLIGRGDVGLDAYGQYVCQGVADRARAILKDGVGALGGADANAPATLRPKKDGIFYANALNLLFGHITQIVDGHGGLVERHYGGGKMIKVIERLQGEADVQGGIIVDSWSDERGVDRALTDVKSYPFSFLVQSFLPQNRGFGAPPRLNSPAPGTDGRSSEDEGVSMREVDALLSEIAIMLSRWSAYSHLLAQKCMESGVPEDTPLTTPEVLTKSNLSRKVSGKLVLPYNVLTTFFFRRSVEKAFQLDEWPTGLSLRMSKPIDCSPPFIISAVEDVMYIANTVIIRSISTSQRGVIDSVLPTISSLLGSDFVGMIQRKMRDECYPKPAIQGGFPPEDKIIQFIVLINSLDMAEEYLTRIISGILTPGEQSVNGGTGAPSQASSLRNSFPFKNDLKEVTTRLNNLHHSFTAKATELLSEGIKVLFSQVVRPRLRPILSDTFRDADYTMTEEELLDLCAANDENEDDVLEQVTRRFEEGWDALMKPIARLMTPKTFSTVLDYTAQHLARWLEKRVWNYAGSQTRGASPYGAIRMERDFSGIIGTISKGNYAVREVFGRTLQILMVANMEDEEWEELIVTDGAAGEDGEDGMLWVLSEDERRKARTIVRVA
ncbi:COG4 transport protein-domain-containing protein [Copromyces sp. CBS 386.78]|nr:COG4 transport protein-domain-containing protein [Copromyces sp. CBS 386.78]